MIQKERLDLILQELEKKESLTTNEVTELTGSSRDTARRDIVKLTENNLAQRIYGGIAIIDSFKKINSYLDRASDAIIDKKSIAKAASKLIKNNGRYYFDVSTTVSILPQFLKNIRPLISVTNSIDIADQFLINTDNPIRILGGDLDQETRSVRGTRPLKELDHYYFDIAFMGVAGIDKDGVYYYYSGDVDFKNKLRENTEKIALLIDSTKINRKHNFKAFDLQAADYLITNKILPKDLEQEIVDNKIKIIYTEE